MRADQLWAPADNDADGTRRAMSRFYRLVVAVHGPQIDPAEAARLDVEWWRVHRQVQHGDPAGVAAITQALADLYAYVYDAPLDAVRPAALERAAAMVISDAWVADGCPDDDPRLLAERAALVRSYAALLHAVHR